MHIQNFPDGAIVSMSAEQWNAVVASLGLVSDHTGPSILNEVYDFLSENGWDGSGFTATVEENPNFDPEDELHDNEYQTVLREA